MSEITKAQITAVRAKVYAKYEAARKLTDGPLYVSASSDGLHLTLQDVRVNGRRNIRDTYRFDGKIISKKNVEQITKS